MKYRNNSMNSRITKLKSIDNLCNRQNKDSVANNNRLIKSMNLPIFLKKKLKQEN